MPFAQVDDANTQFFYEDSGVPILQDRPYTSLVVVHGYGFNSHIFHRLLPIATASHIRLILFNRRGYSGSTPFSEEEISAFNPQESANQDEPTSITPRYDRVKLDAYMAFSQQRGAEMARFLAWFIDKEEIPPYSDEAGRASGGISVLGWSLGNLTTLSLLGFANTLDPGLMKKLERYLRKVVLYDASHRVLGYHTPVNTYNPMFDPELSPEQQRARFLVWVSSYWLHSSSALDLETPLRDRMDGLGQRTPDPSKEATINRLSPGDVKVCVETITPAHGEFFLDVEIPVQKTVRMHAIFGNLNETSSPVVLPKVEISFIWGTRSTWGVVLAARSLKEEISSPPAYHYPVRPVKFFALEGGNHFAHWDDPLKAFATFAQALE